MHSTPNSTRPKTPAMPRRNKLSVLFGLVAALPLAACDKPDNAPGPGGVSMGEARALDRAAEIIEERQVQVPPPESGDATAGASDADNAPQPSGEPSQTD